MREALESLTWPLRELVWKIDERVVWPLVDAVERVQGLSVADRSETASAPAPGWRRYGPDLLLAGLLTVVAFLVRRHGLPTDGLWLDDAVVGAGLKSLPSHLLTVGANNPGFFAVLSGWSGLTGGSDAGLAYPALIAGVLGPPLLYLALRWFGYSRSISALLAAALAAAETDIVYSGRVKTYTIDMLIVLGMAMIIPRLTRMRWRWYAGVAWVAAAALLASFSAFALIAVAVAGAMVLLHPASDLRVRAVAVAAQEGACVAILRASADTYNRSSIESVWRQNWDGFLTFNPNPFRFGGEMLVHLRRIAEAFPGGPAWFAMLCILTALIGLLATGWKGRGAIRARYLLLVLLVAVVGGVLGNVPFGPKVGSALSNGQRLSLWLIPVVAIGLAIALQTLRGLLAGRRGLRVGFDAAAYLATAAVLVSAITAKQLAYPWPGAKSATDFVKSHLGPHDAVLIPWPADFSFAAESDFSAGVEAQPASAFGFSPKFGDPRLYPTDVGVPADQVTRAMEGADRVFVYISDPFDSSVRDARTTFSKALTSLHYKSERNAAFGVVRVEVWRPRTSRSTSGVRTHPTCATSRPQPKPKPQPAEGGQQLSLSQANLRLSDFPQCWKLAAPPQESAAKHVLACLEVLPANKTTEWVLRTKGPDQLSAISDVIGWRSPAGAQRAYAALRGPGAAPCIRDTLESVLTGFGSQVSVIANEVPPPATAGSRTVAYRVIIHRADGSGQLAQGTVVLFTRGRASSLMLGLRAGQQPFPRGLLSNLSAAIAHRMKAAAVTD
jgi:hypothetical protein